MRLHESVAASAAVVFAAGIVRAGVEPCCPVEGSSKVSAVEGMLTGPLGSGDRFGRSVASLGDLDGDLVGDIAVGAWGDDDGGDGRGAVWVLLLNADGTVKAEQKISTLSGGFGGTLNNEDAFGMGVAPLGDLDGDGVMDIAVSAPFADDGGVNRGSVWIVLLNADGTVKGQQKIADATGGFAGGLDNDDSFGFCVTSLGDLDGDGTVELATGAWLDDDGGPNRGAVWILSLTSAGLVDSAQKISDTEGGFGGVLENEDGFGISVCALGDIDGDGIGDLAVGMSEDDDGGTDRGAVWILMLNADRTVKAQQKISDSAGGFAGLLEDGDAFGASLGALGDADFDGVPDLAVGALGDDDGGAGTAANRGAVWLLLLNGDGTVKASQKVSDTAGGFGGALEDGDLFGSCVGMLGDLDGLGGLDIAVGAQHDDDGADDAGAVWILSLDLPTPPCPGDIDGDLFIGFHDLNQIVSFFNTDCPKEGECPQDIDGDGFIGFDDLNVVVSFFNTDCPT